MGFGDLPISFCSQIPSYFRLLAAEILYRRNFPSCGKKKYINLTMWFLPKKEIQQQILAPFVSHLETQKLAFQTSWQMKKKISSTATVVHTGGGTKKEKKSK